MRAVFDGGIDGMEIFARSAGLLLACAAFLLAADPAQCPAQIQVHQQLASPVAGWQARIEELPYLLAGITFFEGKPEDNASLAPDSERNANGKTISRWNFPSSRPPIWLACRYAWTSVTLARELPKEIRVCTITYNPRQTIGGLPEIEKIDCR